MEIVSIDSFLSRKDFFIDQANKNKIFVYPTDSIYGIGCIYNDENLMKINKIKKRESNKICSVIAPSIQWIFDNYKTDNLLYQGKTITIKNLEELENLILNCIKKYSVCTFIFENDKPGVRIIKHGFQKFVENLDKPIITTSVNLNGENHITNISDIPEEIEKNVDFAINDGQIDSKPSVLINFTDGTIKHR